MRNLTHFNHDLSCMAQCQLTQDRFKRGSLEKEKTSCCKLATAFWLLGETGCFLFHGDLDSCQPDPAYGSSEGFYGLTFAAVLLQENWDCHNIWRSSWFECWPFPPWFQFRRWCSALFWPRKRWRFPVRHCTGTSQTKVELMSSVASCAVVFTRH